MFWYVLVLANILMVIMMQAQGFETWTEDT
jgi:hypothetical protein